MHLEKGKVYIINDINSGKLAHMKDDVKNHFDTYTFLNFPDKNSLKINNCYKKLKNRIIEEAKREISHIIEEDFGLEDAEYSEKAMIISYLLLKEHDVLAVNTAGMSFYSIDYFKEKFTKITVFLDRILILYSDK